MDKLMCIDLFSGLGGWSAAFKDRGHEVYTVDVDPRFEPDLCEDMFNVRPCDLPANPTVILASPPCNHLSVLTCMRDWGALGKERHPRNEETVLAVGLVAKTLHLVRALEPRYWVMENPRAMLRKVAGPPRLTTFFASWNPGGPYKPTDVWGVIPKMEWPKPKDWIKVPRGSNKGTQGQSRSAVRAKIPYGLSEALCKAIEREVE